MARKTDQPPQVIRRPMAWGTRVLISIGIPLLLGIGASALGIQRWLYNNAIHFWKLAGLYPHDLSRKYKPPLSGTLRYVTEGLIYAIAIIPAFVLAIFIYDRLTFRYTRSDQIHCPQCGHILQGLTEPRCPECGRPI